MLQLKRRGSGKPAQPSRVNWLVLLVTFCERWAPASQPAGRRVSNQSLLVTVPPITGAVPGALHVNPDPLGRWSKVGEQGRERSPPRGLPPRGHLALLFGAPPWQIRQQLWVIALGSLVTGAPEHLCQGLQTHTGSQAGIRNPRGDLGGSCASKGGSLCSSQPAGAVQKSRPGLVRASGFSNKVFFFFFLLMWMKRF